MSPKQQQSSRERFERCVLREKELSPDLTAEGALIASVIKRMGWGKDWPHPRTLLALEFGVMAHRLTVDPAVETEIRKVLEGYLSGELRDAGLDSFVEIRAQG